VQIVDNLAGSTITTVNVLIDNVAPVVAAGPDRITVLNVPVQFAGHFSDQGALDTHTSTWDFGDGSLPGQGMALTHVYTRTGVFTATLAVTDDDTGVGVDAALITVRAQWYLPLLRKN
jgi:PKD repeat protein